MSNQHSIGLGTSRLWSWLLGASFLAGCGATQPPAPQTPASPPPVAPSASAPAPAAEPKDPFAVPAGLLRESIPALAPGKVDPAKMVLAPLRKPRGKDDAQAIEILPTPAQCARYVANKAKPAPSCATREESLAALDDALAQKEPLERDKRLSALEKCAGMPAGIVRALRADLAPAECADALVAPALAAKEAPAPEVHPVLFALALGARLRRAGQAQPKLAPPFDKQRVAEFHAGPMRTWITSQARAIELISLQGVELSSYARGVVAVEAGMADMRIVEAVRATPLPQEYAKDKELEDAYFGALEQSLDPRKARGRSASLVGLKDLAGVGVISDSRVDQARGLLSRMFGGRRIDSLDHVAVPPLAAAEPATLDQRLAARLPTWYYGMLVAPEKAKDPAVLRQLVSRGVPGPMRSVLQEVSDPSGELGKLVLRMRIAMGTRYWRAVDFDEATTLASQKRDPADRASEQAFFLALALGLRGGPNDAAEMMQKAPAVSQGMGDVAALDAVSAADRSGGLGALAALDAAIIDEVTPPASPDHAFWSSVAARYSEAARRLSDPGLRQLAEQRAKAAQDVATASQVGAQPAH